MRGTYSFDYVLVCIGYAMFNLRPQYYTTLEVGILKGFDSDSNKYQM